MNIIMSASSSSESVSSPEVVSESRGSSVSTGLREEYEDLLRYAVVTPVLNASTVKSSRVLKNQSSGGPPPRSSPPPRPHTPPRHLSRSEAKAKGIVGIKNLQRASLQEEHYALLEDWPFVSWPFV